MTSNALAGFDAEQLRNFQASVDEVKREGLPVRAAEILLTTEMTESSGHNLSGGDRDSAGVLQQRPSQGWGTFAQVTNVNYAVRKFLSRLTQVPGWNTKLPWQAAQSVQVSAFADGSNYQENWARMSAAADELYGAAGGSAPLYPSTGAGGSTTAQPASLVGDLGNAISSPWLQALVPGLGLVSGLGNAAGSIGGDVASFAANIGLKLMLCGAGVALVVAGVIHTTAPARQAAMSTAAQAAPLAAAL